MKTVRTIADLRAVVRGWRAAGETVGLVTTMGALHEGHLTLIDAAAAGNGKVISTIFVNPSQFGPSEDLSRYPRREAEDAEMLAARGADLLFAPPVDEVYPDGFATTVSVAGVTEALEGKFRPGHFEGVATVVAKLLLQSLPDRAYFGEKDWQQLQTITRMARDLDIPVEIAGVPTVREDDGLAMSSRNAYLSADERRIAGTLNVVLREVAASVAEGGDPEAAAEQGAAKLREAGFDPVQYVAVRDAEDLGPPRPGTGGDGRAMRVLAAAKVGKTRLIDNFPVEMKV